MENPYLQFNLPMLRSFERMYRADIKDSTLTLKKQTNARIKLALVREAIRQK